MVQLGPWNAHDIERRRVEDIDAASPIHQDLVDPLGLEQGSHHERAATRLWHVVGVVRLVESDRSL
jgi:hypothetical protein